MKNKLHKVLAFVTFFYGQSTMAIMFYSFTLGEGLYVRVINRETPFSKPAAQRQPAGRRIDNGVQCYYRRPTA